MKAFAGNRVLMLLENNPYPQDRRVAHEASALAEAGLQVSVICPAARGQSKYECVNGVHVYRFPAPPAANRFLGYLWEYGYGLLAFSLLSLVVFVRRGFDVIHVHNPPDTLVFIAAFYKLLGRRFVYDHHDLAPEMYYARFPGRGRRWVYRVLVALEKLSCRLADHVIATNQSYKKVEIERGGVPPERITIVRNGPDLNRMRPVEPDPELRRKAKTIIGYVGTLGFQDGLDYLLRTLRHLVADLGRTDFYCVVIGTGDALPSLKTLAGQLALHDYVTFTGLISHADLLRYLSTADICVVPDPSNPFTDRSTMIKLMEYMSLSKPIVAFDLPEHRFTAEQAALYVAPNDELEFARALVELMDDPGRRQAMASFGRRRVESVLAWPYSVPCLLEAYRSLFPDPEGGNRAAAREQAEAGGIN